MANIVDPGEMAYLYAKLTIFVLALLSVTMNRTHSIDAIFGITKRHKIYAV